MGAQVLVISLSSVLMITLVNRFGVETTAAYGALMQLWMYIIMPALAMATAVSTVAAQNVGARNWTRVRSTARLGMRYSFVVTAAIVAVIYAADSYAYRVDVFLTGAPSMQQHVTSELRRGVLSAQREMSHWSWNLAAIASHETAHAWVDHMLDPVGLAAALSPPDTRSMPTANEPIAPLNVFAMQPGGPDAPERIWAPAHRDRFASSGWHVLGSLEGPLGPARLQLGVDRRTEAMRFRADVGRVLAT